MKQIKKINTSNLNYYICKLKTIVVYMQINNTKRIKIINCITKTRKTIKQILETIKYISIFIKLTINRVLQNRNIAKLVQEREINYNKQSILYNNNNLI